MSIKDFSAEEIRFQTVWASSGIPPRLAQASFANYQTAEPEKEQALKKCHAFAEKGLEIINQGQGIFLQGPVGTGNYQRFLVMERF